MSENESTSEKEKMVYDSGRDRLSELPSCIIDIILSSISTRDAVHMSILSRQFRYSWVNLPHLVFDFPKLNSEEYMEKFVTTVLKLHKGPIHKFVVLLKQSLSSVNEWLLLLPKNEIRELNLKFDYEYRYFHRPTQRCNNAYYFNNLTSLELQRCQLGPPPLSFTGFLFLRRLILVNVMISFNDVEAIVAKSPLLETLKLDSGHSPDGYTQLRISAPNLKYFEIETYSGDCVRLHLCAPILAEMRIDVIGCDNYYLLEKLKGNCFAKSYGADSFQYSFMLPHLKVIKLNNVKSGVVKQMSIVARLVAGAPNLQELKITCDLSPEEYTSDSDSDSDSDSEEAQEASLTDFKCEKLKIVRMKRISGLPSEIQFLKLLLENSPALERMNVHSFQENEDLREKILNCNPASPNFELLFSFDLRRNPNCCNMKSGSSS